MDKQETTVKVKLELIDKICFKLTFQTRIFRCRMNTAQCGTR